MATVNVYINFEGNCEEAFNFYKEVFGGEFSYLQRYSEMPPQEGVPPVPEGAGDKIMHMSLPISNETLLMGSDLIEGWGMPFQKGNNISLYVDVPDKHEADRVFSGLSTEGTVTMEMENTFWGSYFGSLTDKFGINWMIGAETREEA